MTLRAKLLLALYVLMTLTVGSGSAWIAYSAYEKMKAIAGNLAEFQSLGPEYSENARKSANDVNELMQLLSQLATNNDMGVLDQIATVNANLRNVFTKQGEIAGFGKIVLVEPFRATLGGAQWKLMDRKLDEFESAMVQLASTPPSADGVREQRYRTAKAGLSAIESTVGRADAEAAGLVRLAEFSHFFGDLRSLLLVVPLFLTALCSWLTFSAYKLLMAKTRLERAEAELQEARAALERQDKLALKAQAASELVHELTNPLTAIDINASTLETALSKGTAKPEDVSVIRTGIQRLKEMFKAYRDLERVPEPNLLPTSSLMLLREVQNLWAPLFAKAGIVLKLDTVEDVPLHADPQQLHQVLVNLIKNAAESIGHDGHVILHAHRDIATLRSGQTNVVIIEVEDTGPGIPVEMQERVFDPFVTTKAQDGGRGMGLAIAARIVDKHGGRLDFRTKIGEGTTFRVTLPAGGAEQ